MKKLGFFRGRLWKLTAEQRRKKPSEKYRLLTIATKLSKILYGVVKNEKKNTNIDNGMISEESKAKVNIMSRILISHPLLNILTLFAFQCSN